MDTQFPQTKAEFPQAFPRIPVRSHGCGAIYEKLNKILHEVGKIPKNGFNAFHKYHYMKESDITEALRPLLAKHGLAVAFSTNEIREMRNDCLAVEVEITIGDAAGNEITSTVWGMGQDRGEKGIYKAMTGAVKYWLYKSFLVSTDDDPEATDVAEKNGTAAPSETKADSKDTKIFIPASIKPGVKGKSGRMGPSSIVTPGGKELKTFSQTFLAIAEDAMKNKQDITVTFQKTKYGMDITSLVKVGSLPKTEDIDVGDGQEPPYEEYP